jgi:hypothetical protein
MRSDCGAIAFAAPVARSSFNNARAIPNASSTAHDSAQPLGRYLLHRRLMTSCTGNCGFAASDPHRSTYFNGTPYLLPDGGATASCSGPPPGPIRATRTRVERLQQVRDEASDINVREPIPRRRQLRENLLDLIDTELEPDRPLSFRTGPRGALRAVPNDRTPGDHPADRLHRVRGCGTPRRCGWPLYQGHDLPGAWCRPHAQSLSSESRRRSRSLGR